MVDAQRFDSLSEVDIQIPSLMKAGWRGISVSTVMAIFALLFSLLLAGCGSTSAPVSSREPPPGQKIKYHIIAPGDTLYAIAWRYELTVESLAAANGVSRPYAIYPGQRLILDTAQTKASSRAAKPTGKTGLAAGASSGTAIKTTEQTKDRPATEQITRVSRPPTYTLPKGQWSWQWPVKGSVSRHYDTNRVFKGLDIQAGSGHEVKTAAPGVVVYAGRGLRGYGQLLIIKHSEAYLSAYAHNRKIYVKEGQSVVAGQKISEVGGDPENQGRLYFEIRQNGKPIDPMRVLPRL